MAFAFNFLTANQTIYSPFDSLDRRIDVTAAEGKYKNEIVHISFHSSHWSFWYQSVSVTLFFLMFPQIFIIQFLVFPSWIEPVQVGSINDVVFSSSSAIVASMNGSSVDCICIMLLSTNIMGVSYSPNETCLLFFNYSLSYTLNHSPGSSFHFLILPPEQQYSTYETTQKTQISEF